jgi:hypothetical protein
MAAAMTFIMLAQETEPCGSVRLTRSLKHPRDARNNKGTPARQFQPRALRRASFIDAPDPAYPDHGLAPDVIDWSVLIVVVVIGVISIAAMIVPVIGHRISNCCAPNPTHDRAVRTANNSTGDGAPNPSSDRAAFVGKGNLR